MSEVQPVFPSFKNTILGKIVVLGILVFLLLIPLASLSSILRDRLDRRNEAVAEIQDIWGAPQHIVGPVMIVPYKRWYKVWKEDLVEVEGSKEKKFKKVEVMEFEEKHAYFLPEELQVTGSLTPNILHRGIYQAVVYKADLKLTGHFLISFDKLKIKLEDVLWNDAQITVGIADLRGTKEAIKIKLGTSESIFLPGCKLDAYSSGIHSPVKLSKEIAADNIPYEIVLQFQGSQKIVFAPLGVKNTVRLTSSWPDPSFCGAYLPGERTVGPQGFDALWQISYYGRSYPQQWTSYKDSYHSSSSLSNSFFGVSLLSLVDAYRCVERSINYALLFIIVILSVFFLFEIVSKLRIHPFQYLLVAAALTLFYLLLLSISEFISFEIAYTIGAGISSLLVVLYSMAVLKSGTRTATIFLGLVADYVFLYFILQMQDYSILTGSILLTLLLASIMYFTRNINWYKPEVDTNTETTSS